MKINMKSILKSLLKDKNVLYVVFFIAITNLIAYMLIRDLNAVVFMFIVGYLTSYFSKNMIIVLLTAIITTNLFAVAGWLSQGSKTTEGFNQKKSRKIRERMSISSRPAPASADLDEEEATGKQKNNVDYAATLESAYDNLDKFLGSDAVRNMSKDTQRLAEKQKKLMENIKTLEPMMQKAGAMLEGLDSNKIGGMIEGLQGKMKKLGV